MKPTALLHADYKYKCWIDIDCEVVGNISDIFDNFEEDKIACAPDEFHSWGCRWQTGVFGTVGEPSILGQWAEMSQKATNRGDQEILWDIVKEDEFKYIKELSADYNWLRLSIEKGNENPNAKIIHWTGPAGKKIIRGKWKWSKK